MTLAEIQAAVLAGQVVCKGHHCNHVRVTPAGRWFVVFVPNAFETNLLYAGQLDGDESEYFVATPAQAAHAAELESRRPKSYQSI